jgi:hypothetical protein
VPAAHATSGAVQKSRLPPVPPGLQHGCPLPPHVPQLPFAHTPATVGHIPPALAQVSPTQQPPPEQVLPPQHG